jgi:DNA-binding transcriptional ArsR family regulator
MITASSLLGSLITSKMRVRILMRLFLNPSQQVYLRELSSEFQASPSQVRDELNSLRETGLLESAKRGRQIYYKANQGHPLYPELHSMVKKALGMDHILESILYRLGDLEKVILLDDYAQGKDTGIIDLLLIGEINEKNLADIVAKTENYIGRKIRTLLLSKHEYKRMLSVFENRPSVTLWKSGNSQQ